MSAACSDGTMAPEVLSLIDTSPRAALVRSEHPTKLKPKVVLPPLLHQRYAVAGFSSQHSFMFTRGALPVLTPGRRYRGTRRSGQQTRLRRSEQLDSRSPRAAQANRSANRRLVEAKSHSSVPNLEASTYRGAVAGCGTPRETPPILCFSPNF